MNSTVFDDLSREHLALETANNLKKLFANTENVTAYHKELLEVNLSLTAYIEESKTRLHDLRNQLAQKAKSSGEIVDIYNRKSE